MTKEEATYQYLKEAHGNGMFFFTHCCGNRMYSIDNNPMKYHGCLCPKCFWNDNKLVTLYLRGTPDGIRVESEDKELRLSCFRFIRLRL
jgi:hypothetical protein